MNRVFSTSMVTAPQGVLFHTHHVVRMFQSISARYNLQKKAHLFRECIRFSSSNKGTKPINRKKKQGNGGQPRKRNRPGNKINSQVGILFIFFCNIFRILPFHHHYEFSFGWMGIKMGCYFLNCSVDGFFKFFCDFTAHTDAP